MSSQRIFIASVLAVAMLGSNVLAGGHGKGKASQKRKASHQASQKGGKGKGGGLLGHGGLLGGLMGGHGGRCHTCRLHETFDGQDPWANCGCNGSYKFPVPPLYTYHWPGINSQRLMTDYHSPWRFPAIKPFEDEDTADDTIQVEPRPTFRNASREARNGAPIRRTSSAPARRSLR